MRPEIRHIIFDIGKVLIHYDPEVPFLRLIPDAAERSWFLGDVCDSNWNLEQDRGRDWNEAEAKLIAQHPDRADHIRAFRTYWHEMVPYALDESVELLERFIAEGRDVTLLTNFAADTFAEAQERYPFLKKPRGVTVSGRVGVIKPDRAIYDIHAQTFDLDPDASLFIDDSLPNVEAARDFGWHAIHFTGPQTLAAELADYGLMR